MRVGYYLHMPEGRSFRELSLRERTIMLEALDDWIDQLNAEREEAARPKEE